jgi:hypothetical protein
MIKLVAITDLPCRHLQNDGSTTYKALAVMLEDDQVIVLKMTEAQYKRVDAAKFFQELEKKLES